MMSVDAVCCLAFSCIYVNSVLLKGVAFLHTEMYNRPREVFRTAHMMCLCSLSSAQADHFKLSVNQLVQHEFTFYLDKPDFTPCVGIPIYIVYAALPQLKEAFPTKSRKQQQKIGKIIEDVVHRDSPPAPS